MHIIHPEFLIDNFFKETSLKNGPKMQFFDFFNGTPLKKIGKILFVVHLKVIDNILYAYFFRTSQNKGQKEGLKSLTLTLEVKGHAKGLKKFIQMRITVGYL